MKREEKSREGNPTLPGRLRRPGWASIEHAIQELRKGFEASEGLLQLDASNAFNRLNRVAALHNMRAICPVFATAIENTYCNNSKLFVEDEFIYSQEVTTQGDSLAMAMYAMSVMPLIEKLGNVKTVLQKWFADDANATGQLSELRKYFDFAVSEGPKYGYFVHPGKCVCCW